MILFLFALSHFTTINSIVLIRDALTKLTYVVKEDVCFVYLCSALCYLFSVHCSSDLVQGKNIRNKRSEMVFSVPVTSPVSATHGQMNINKISTINVFVVLLKIHTNYIQYRIIQRNKLFLIPL